MKWWVCISFLFLHSFSCALWILSSHFGWGHTVMIKKRFGDFNQDRPENRQRWMSGEGRCLDKMWWCHARYTEGSGGGAWGRMCSVMYTSSKWTLHMRCFLSPVAASILGNNERMLCTPTSPTWNTPWLVKLAQLDVRHLTHRQGFSFPSSNSWWTDR